jgi:hypothetical protein
MDAYRVLELSRRMAVFFDQAAYRVARTFDTGRQACRAAPDQAPGTSPPPSRTPLFCVIAP